MKRPDPGGIPSPDTPTPPGITRASKLRQQPVAAPSVVCSGLFFVAVKMLFLSRADFVAPKAREAIG
jgi:hypothetical protein